MYLANKPNPLNWLRQFCYCFFLVAIYIYSPLAFAADIEAVLDDATGTSAFSVKDSSSVEKAHIDSLGNINLKGCLRLDATGVECATPENLIVDGNIGIGTTGPQGALAIGSTGQFQVALTGALSTNQTATFTNASSIVTTGNVGIGTNFTPDALIVMGGNVGIGTWGPQGALEVRNGPVRIGTGTVNFATAAGDLYVGRNLEVDGDVHLGDATLDNVVITGTLTQQGGNTQDGPLTVDDNNVEALLVRKDSDAGDVFTVNTNDSVVSVNGNLGVGTIAPSQKLEVQGSVRIVGNSTTTGNTTTSGTATFTNASSIVTTGNVGIGTTSTQDALVVTSGNVGIGTWAPQSALEVRNGLVRFGSGSVDHVSAAGDVYVANGLEVDGSVWLGDAAADNLTVTGSFTQTGDSNITGNFGVGTTTPQTKLAVLGPVGIGTWTTNLGVGLAVLNGNVGIASTSPGNALDVIGSIRSSAGIVTGGNLTAAGNAVIAGSLGVAGISNSTSYTQSGSSANTLTGTTTINNALSLVTTGNVGIGSAAPSSLLDVNGSVRIGTGVFNNSSGGSDLYVTGNLEVDGSAYLGDNATVDNIVITGTLTQAGDSNITGNFGVGTTTPQTKLAVLGPVGIGTWTTNLGVGLAVLNGNVGVGLASPSTALDVNGTVRGSTVISTGTLTTAGVANSSSYTQSGSSANTLTGTTTINNALSLVTTGNVGIGSAAPSQLLDVNGSVRIGTGSFDHSSGGSDLYVTGNLEVDGSAYLGDNATVDNIVITGTLTQAGDSNITGNFGVGTTTPQTKLAVLGPVGIGTWTTQTGVGLAVLNGNVGIGSLAPLAALDVNGNLVLSGASRTITTSRTGGTTGNDLTIIPSSGNGANGGSLTLSSASGTGGGTAGSITMSAAAGSTGTVNITTGNTGGGAGNSAAINLTTGTSTSGMGGNISLTPGTGSAANGMVLLNGNVGISSTAPGSALDVNGDMRVGLGTFNNPSSNADLYVTGNLEVDGSAYLGDNATVDNITITGTLTQTGDSNITGNFGVGTTTPQTKLAVLGPVGIGTWTTQTGVGLAVLNGNVGIGIVTPISPLDIGSSSNSSYTLISTMQAPNLGVGNNAYYRIGKDATNPYNSVQQMFRYAGSGSNQNAYVVNFPTSNDLFMIRADGSVGVGTTLPTGLLEVGAQKFNVLSSGNVGVGIISPVQTLDVRGTGYFSSNLGIGSLAPSSTLDVNGDMRVGLGTFNNPSANTDLYVSGNLEVDGSAYLGDNATVDNIVVTGTLTQTGDSNITGNFGVGTTTPQTKLAVLGPVGIGTWTTTAGTGLTVLNGNVGFGTSAPGAALQVGTGTLFVDAVNGNVGINATTPITPLHVVGSADELSLQTSSTSIGATASLRFKVDTIVGSGYYKSGIYFERKASDGLGTLHFVNSSAAGNTNVSLSDARMSITSAGNVGIGSSAPGDKLSVQGTVRVGSGVFNNPSGTQADLYVTGNLEVDGSAYLGDNATVDNIVITGTLTQAGDSNITGNFGVGTTTPQTKLAVLGPVGIGTWTTNAGVGLAVLNGNVGIGNATPATALDVTGTVRGSTVVSTGVLTTAGVANSAGYTQTGSNANTISGTTTFTNATSLITNGNVGIGSISPGTILDVTGTIRSSAGVVTAGIANSSSYTQSGSSANTLTGTTTINNALSLVTTGNVGIGSAAPSQLLDVNGSVRIGTGSFDHSSGGSDLYVSGNLEVDGSAYLGDNATVDNIVITGTLTQAGDSNITGNFGVGTTTPQTKLAVLGPVGIGTWTTTAGTGLAVLNGNVGVGMASPATALDISGTARATDLVATGTVTTAGITNTSSYTQSGSSANILTGTTTINNTLSLITTGNVGIGSTNPGQLLDVQGTVRVLNGGNMGIGTSYTPNRLYVAGTAEMQGFKLPTGDNSTGYVLTSNAVGVGTWMSLSDINTSSGLVSTGTADRVAIYDTATNAVVSSSVITDDNTNVGISSTAPGQKLDIAGSLRINETSNGTLTVGDDFSVSSAGAIATNGGYTQSNTSLNTFSGQTRVTVTGTALTVDAGNTGLGTSSPSSRLSVLGGVGVGSNAYAVGNAAPIGGMAIEGNVGIGTFEPTQKLDVRGTVTATNFVGSGAGLTNLPAGGAAGSTTQVQYNNAGNMAGSNNFIFDGTNVGIGSTAPGQKLDVTGTVRIAGNMQLIGASRTLSTTDNGTDGYSFTINPAAGVASSGVGGGITLTGGTGNSVAGTPGNGGAITITGGTAGTVTGNYGNGGAVTISGGPSSNGATTGALTLQSGASLGAASTGTVTLASPNGTGASGAINITTGSATGTTGNITITAGTATSGAPGSITVSTGASNAAGYANIKLLPGTSGSVGIGSSNPGQMLDVAGTVRILNSGNLGIGTSYAPNKLYVAGTAEMQGFKMSTGSSSTGYVLTSNSVGVGTWMSLSALSAASGTVSTGTADRVAIYDTATNTVVSSSVITDDNTNIGIGSTAPGEKLDIAGNVRLTTGNLGIGTWVSPAKLYVQYSNDDYTNTDGENNAIFIDNTSATGQSSMQFNIGGNPMMKFRSDYVGDLSWIAYPANTSAGHYFIVGGEIGSGGVTKMKISTNGITIGSDVTADAPDTTLRIQSTTQQLRVNYDASNYYGTTVGSTGKVSFDAVGTDVNFNFADNVGISSTAPGQKLDINGTVRLSGSLMITPSSVTNITAGGGITVTGSVMNIQGSGGAVDISANPQIVAGTNGQMAILIGNSNANTVKLDNGNGLKLSSGVSFTLGLSDTMTLIYDAANSVWVELSRVDN